MKKDIRPDEPLGAERAIRSREAAAAYLDSVDEHVQAFAGDFLWEWWGHQWLRERGELRSVPPPEKQRRQRARDARKVLDGASGGLAEELQHLIDELEHPGPGRGDLRRRLATKPEDERFALLLALRGLTRGVPVSGRLAAVIARVAGVAKRAGKRVGEEDPALATVRAWEASMARATRSIRRWANGAT
ncbi:MAG: hypothetical protein HZB56_23865 [Deltaproteobacteria bacterium]|nr:hypothetical protein [Deltaproteobacteria bacterium]